MTLPALIQEWRRIAKARALEADDEFMQGHYYDSEEIKSEVRTLTRCADDLEKALGLFDTCEAEAPLLTFINKTPGLLSLLYDLNALPETARGQIRANMRSVTIGWMACENWHQMKPQPPGPGGGA